MKENIHILLFYKYIDISDLKEFQSMHLNDCNSLGIKGRILIANEGINGSVSGTKEQIEQYKALLRSDSRFKDIRFKEDIGIMHPFKKMQIKIKTEIVNMNQKVNLSNTGPYISPKELLDIYNSNEDIIILDARNEYEARIGKFKNSINLPIKKFREFPKAIEQLQHLKEKKIVTYCTGGIRCEKATAYMKEIGFKNVFQLKDGILNFGKEFPDTIWEGKCFVFDKRLMSKVNSSDETISNCDICNISCDLYRNCRNERCDKYIIVCPACKEKYAGCCSKNCFNEFLSKTRLTAPIQ